MPHPKLTKGCVALQKALSERGKAACLAVDLDCEPAIVSRWRSGSRTPGIAYAAKLEAMLGIPIAWWSIPVTSKRAA